ncbi:unnamed protein product [Didymodactylos carnosus]|uniref:Uncharacterized protein n=1 Tax=Didymodactylos carnosus TaxID=1234261 RepID=A0A814YVQ1_9BILA|nr:unnamed protein product [Didymodactylos carnosus]CAF3996843.1 unnamed protein product [Didymodactylos carnosus]
MALRGKRAHDNMDDEKPLRYTTINNIKDIQDLNNAKRYITSTCHTIWKLDRYDAGREFIQDLCQSIDRLPCNGELIDGFEYINDDGEMAYILFVIRSNYDGKMIHVASSHHKISKSISSSFNNNSTPLTSVEQKSMKWLKQRAFHEVHLSESAMKQLMHKSMDYPIIELPKDFRICRDDRCRRNNDTILTAEEGKTIIDKSEATPNDFGWRYNIYNKLKHDKTILNQIPEILLYSKRIDGGERMIDELWTTIKTVQAFKNINYPFYNAKGEIIMLAILIRAFATMPFFEIVCRFQTCDT